MRYIRAPRRVMGKQETLGPSSLAGSQHLLSKFCQFALGYRQSMGQVTGQKQRDSQGPGCVLEKVL